jgi:NAD(P)H-hydrate epimerase
MEYTGAAYLATAACLRSGAGYTALFLPAKILPYYILKAPEALLVSVCKGERYAFDSSKMRVLCTYDSVAFGMGMGVSKEVYQGAEYLLKHYDGKLILDADGLNSLAVYAQDLRELFQSAKCDVLITPHAKEFSRLFVMPMEEILSAPAVAAHEKAKQYGISILLKGWETAISNGVKTRIVDRGTSGQAKGGSGDVLSGLIAGLCAQGVSAFDGGVLGGYLAGLSAEIATAKTGEYSLLATDVIQYLGRAFQTVQNG